jgi:hypothetical protein
MNMDGHPTEPIRQAVASGEFQKALLLWNGYAALLREELRNGSLTDARLADVRELVEWSRLVVLCGRAHTQSRLDSMRVAQTYDQSRSEPAAIIQTSL